ncbi:MAG: methionine adenosyltransferase domain-containing protein [Candidatus Micrarchaeia archaeon]
MASIITAPNPGLFKEKINHSFEAGRRGKPDELESILANRIAAYFLEKDRLARFDLRISGTVHNGRPLVRVSGEVSAHLISGPGAESDIFGIILAAYNRIHRTSLPRSGIEVNFNFKPQSPKLAQNGRAGDSGEPIAVAYSKSPNFLPWERYLAVELRDMFDWIYQHNGRIPARLSKASGVSSLAGLRADGKIQVNASYSGTELEEITSITVALEHEKDLGIGRLRSKAIALIYYKLGLLEAKYGLRNGRLGFPHLVVNGCGAFPAGGWLADEGTREAKPYRDGFATYGVMEDSFSGEDSSKPSGTGTMLARHIAVSIVGNGLAGFARVALSYVIGKEGVELNITTNGTSLLPQAELESIVRGNFDLSLSGAAESFGLRNPDTFLKIAANSDYFHDKNYFWNKAMPLPGGPNGPKKSM